ncbi:MAG TPA: hypothetical protein VF098_02440 [Sphingomicrobium sp.]
MDAARLGRARRRATGYLFGSGVLMAAVLLCFAAAIVSMFGLSPTSYVVTIILTAAVMAGGAYALIYFGALALHIGRRAWKRQPIMEVED